MAQKKITELQLRSDVTSDLNFPSDDSIQSYRVTAEQIKNYVLGAGNVALSALASAVQGLLVQPGTISIFAGATAQVPSGYLACDGSTVSRTTYAALFAAIGTKHGTGNGTTTFHLPDLRGRFIRGYDNGAGRDVDAASRTAANTGGSTGDNVGSLQGHAFQTHTHTQNAHGHTFIWSNANDGQADYVRSGSGASGTGNLPGQTTATNNNTGATGTHAQASTGETRPVNVAMLYIIKT
jgi:microcystin-dependent protein